MDYAIWDSLKKKVDQRVQDKLTEQALMNKMIIISGEEISIEKIRKNISA